LHDIASVLDVADHINDGIEEAILIFLDQVSKGHGVTLQYLVDQLEVVAHIDLTVMTREGGI
jgi:hypothetical protein